MLVRLLLAAGLAYPLVVTANESAAVAAKLRDAALADNTAYALVSSLTTEIGPRLAGSEADARAAAWAKARFEALGYDTVWTESFPLPRWRRGAASAEVLGPHAQPLLISALGSSVGTPRPIEAEVVELADFAALEAVDDDRLRGKIAFVSRRLQRSRDGADYSSAADARTKGPTEAARRGAVAFLLRSLATDDRRLPHTGNTRVPTDVAPIPAAALSGPDADQLQRLLARGPTRLRLSIDAGFDGETTSQHVIGEIRGRDPDAGIVVLGAHLDSWDLGTGAIDDGAGVAITMAAGAKIAALAQRPRRTIRVIAFGAEEFGLIGAKAYAADHAADLPRHSIGLESDFGAGRIYALRAAASPRAMAEMERMSTVLAPLGIVWEGGKGGPGPDILPLADAGMPWAHLAQDGTDYFDLHHTADDTLDKIDPKALDQQVAAYAALAWMLAESEVDYRPAPPRPAK